MSAYFKDDLVCAASAERMFSRIKDKFEGEFHIDINNIIEPVGENKMFKVRDLDDTVVDTLCSSMLEAVDLPFNAAPIIVLAEGETSDTLRKKGISGCSFIVIDGNHRLRAIRKTYDVCGEYVVKNVLCHVYTELTQDEALKLGVNNNTHNENINVLSDIQKAKLFRGLVNVPYRQNTPVEISCEQMSRLYNILGAKTRKDRRAITPITILVKMSVRCWLLLMSIFEKSKSRKASAFNCLSTFDEGMCYNQLRSLSNNLDFHQFRESCKAAKLCDKRGNILRVEIEDSLIKVKMGKQSLLGHEIKFALPGKTVTYKPPEMMQLLSTQDTGVDKGPSQDLEMTGSNLYTEGTTRPNGKEHTTTLSDEGDTQSNVYAYETGFETDLFEEPADSISEANDYCSPGSPTFKPRNVQSTYQRLQQSRENSSLADVYAIPCTPPPRKKSSLKEFRKRSHEVSASCQDSALSQKKIDITTTHSSAESTSKNSRLQKNSAFMLSEYPENVKPGDWILINPKKEEEEGLWVGEVRSVKRKIKFDWVFNKEGNLWIGGGVMRPKSGVCSIDDVLAVFTYDTSSEMPRELVAKLQTLWRA